MGLDSIEIVMEVEKTFEISIADKEAEQIRTVRDFHEVVWEKIRHKSSAECVSQALFYRLRRLFQEQLSVRSVAIKPETQLNAIVPSKNRRKIWRQLQSDSKLRFPSLVLPRPWSIAIILFDLAVLFVSLGYLYANGRHFKAWLLMAACIVFVALLNKVVAPLRTAFKLLTMRELVYEVLRLNFSLLNKDGVTRREMEQVMNLLFADRIGVSLDEIKPEKSFTNDLGVD